MLQVRESGYRCGLNEHEQLAEQRRAHPIGYEQQRRTESPQYVENDDRPNTLG
jgi:hypothetical protein